ncbi:MAG: WD40 repeat domain-containing protein [Planctomycetaceae bacterium]|jgi:WD40 repeat protein|nr:WD40 repeat domain-containing protein [Planctomycetaceae bacterium]
MQKKINETGIFVTINILCEKSIQQIPYIKTKMSGLIALIIFSLFCIAFFIFDTNIFAANIYADEPQINSDIFPVADNSPITAITAITALPNLSDSTQPQSTQSPQSDVIMESSEVVNLYEYTKNKNRIPVISCLDIDRTGKLLAVGGDDHKVRFWDIEKRTFVMQVHEHLDWVRDLAFSSDQSKLVTIAHDGQIQIWNVKNGTLLVSAKEKIYGLQSVTFNSDGTKIAVCGFDKFVRIYDALSGNLISKSETNETGNRVILFSPDGSSLAVAGRSGIVRIWSMADITNYKDIKGSRRRINTMAFSPDGSKLAIGGDGPFIVILDPKTGKRIKRLPEHPGKTFSLVFCNDNIIASGESDNAIRIWDITQKKQLNTLIGHTGTVATIVFDSEKNLLISGGFDTSIRFWKFTKENIKTENNNITNNSNDNSPNDKIIPLYPLPNVENIQLETPKIALTPESTTKEN